MSVTIESPHNERLKQLRKLHDRKHRERAGLFLAEGEDMLTEALRWGVPPTTVFYDADELEADAPLFRELAAEIEVVAVRGEALRRAGSLGSGSRVIGVWEMEAAGRRQAGNRVQGGADVVVYLHEVSDPGNVGAVLRSALALAPSVVAVSPGTADPYSPKAVRAGMGAIFGQPHFRVPFEQIRSEMPGGARMVALVPGAGKPLRDVDLGAPTAFCVGSERLGLPEGVLSGCDEVCHVPLRPGGAESLNVAMTATLCLYEAALHRLSSRS